MILALTGATGFVGAETMRQALAAGHTIRALTRRAQPVVTAVTWVAGDLGDTAALKELVTGADAVIHIAGVVNAPDRAGFAGGNCEGTANVIAAMHDAGIRRLIHVSSLAAREPELADYCWSKCVAEDYVVASGLDWTAVRPPAAYGPGDTEFRELFMAASRGLFPAPAVGRASLIHVSDLARLLLVLATEAGADTVHKVYEVADDTPNGLSHEELAAAFGRALGRKVRHLPLPRWLMTAGAYADRGVRGARAKLTPDRVRYLCHPDWVSKPALAPPETLWRPQIKTDEGLKRAADAYLASIGKGVR